MNPLRRAILGWLGLTGLSLLGHPAEAVEYRLLVASVFDTALTSTAKGVARSSRGASIAERAA